jgi:hypothetical protein
MARHAPQDRRILPRQRPRRGAAGVYAGDLVQLAQLGTIISLLKYNRTIEAEADAMASACWEVVMTQWR